jgi:hypothetical protein
MRRPRFDRLSPAGKEELNRQLKDVVDARLVRHSRNEFRSSIIFFRKADGSLRLCIDYIGMSEVTRKDDYPLPHVSVTLDDLKVFETLKMRQIPAP